MSELRQNLRTTLFMSTVLLAMVLFWGGLSNQFSNAISDFSDLSKQSEAEVIYTDFKKSSDDVTESDLGGLIRVVNNVIATVRTMLGSVNLFINFLGSILAYLLVPAFIVAFVFGDKIINGFASFINIIRGQEKL